MKKAYLADEVQSILAMAIQRCGGKAELARRANINLPNIGRWERGERSPNITEFSRIMEIAGVSIAMPEKDMMEFDLVQKVEARAGAGASLETSGETVGLYAFRRDFLEANRLSIDNVVLMSVTGDSMQPLLYENDTILINKAEQEVVEGRIFVVTYGDELRVKRLYKSPRGVILRSENREYPDIAIEDADLEQFIIHGRVRWAGRLI